MNIAFNNGFLFLPISLLLVFFVAYQNGIFSKVLKSKIFVYVGNVSGFAFLIHQRCIYFLKGILGKLNLNLNNFVKIIIMFIIVHFITIFYINFEKRLLKIFKGVRYKWKLRKDN